MARKGKRVDKAKLTTQRNADGLTQAALAALAVVPISCVIKGEYRGQPVNPAVLTKLATALGVSENALT